MTYEIIYKYSCLDNMWYYIVRIIDLPCNFCSVLVLLFCIKLWNFTSRIHAFLSMRFPISKHVFCFECFTITKQYQWMMSPNATVGLSQTS